MFLTKNWANSSLAVAGRYVVSLDSPSNTDTLQKLPAVTFTRTRSPIGPTPLYFGLDSSFTEFYRADGVQGQRFDLHPTVAYYHTFSPGLDFSAWGGYRQRLYSDLGADEDKRFSSRGDGLFDGGAALSLPLSKVYVTGGSELLAVRHSLIPELKYNVVQEKNQDRLPLFDRDDRIVGQQMLVLSLTNFVTGKYADAAGSPNYRDILYFKLSQGYQVSGTRRDLLTLVDDLNRFTDIRLEARYALAKRLTVNVDTRYNPYINRISTASTRLDLDDGKGDLVGLGYQFERGTVQYLEGKLALTLVKPFTFKYTGRYSLDRHDFLESDYSLEYKKQCWSVVFAYQDRLANKQFMISFTLAGIGSVGPLKTF
jgi:LPS-assembly protein